MLLRVNGTDYLYHDTSLPQWHIDEAVELGKLLAAKGIDLIDVSGGGNDPRMKVKADLGYQVGWATKIREGVKGTNTYVSGVGMINGAKQANEYIENGDLDVVMVARGFLRDPNLVYTWAKELSVAIWLAAQCKLALLPRLKRSNTRIKMLTWQIDGWAEGIRRPLKNSL